MTFFVSFGWRLKITANIYMYKRLCCYRPSINAENLNVISLIPLTHTNVLFDESMKNHFWEPTIRKWHRYRLLIILYEFFGIFDRNRKHRFSSEQDILQLKLWYQLMHNTIIYKKHFKDDHIDFELKKYIYENEKKELQIVSF